MLRHQGDRTATERPTVGDLKMSMVGVDHIGWLMCDGRELPIAGFRHLYDVIGDSFGDATIEGYFRLPNPKGRVLGIVGKANSISRDWTMGDISGAETHTLTIPEMPKHNHDVSGNAPDLSGNTTYSATSIDVLQNGLHAHMASSANNGNHAHSITDPGHSHTIRSITDSTGEGAIDDAGGSGTINTGSSYTNISIIENGIHNHDITVDASGNHDHDIFDPTHRHTIASNGGDQPHNNIQPTIWIGNLFVYSGRLFRDTPATISSPSDRNWFPPQGPSVNIN